MARTAVANRMKQRTFTTCNVFNGTSSQGVLTTNPTTVTNNWTVAAWIKPTLPSSSMIFFNGNNTNGWGIGIGNGSGGSGSKLVGLSGTIAWINGGPTLTNGVWQHVALTRRNTRWFLYLNGVETDSGSTATVNLTTAGKASVGMQFSGANVPGIFYTGQIDFLRVWNVSLSKGQIFDNYSYDFKPSGCVLELKGTSGIDTSGNGVNVSYTDTTTATSNTSANIVRSAVSNRFKLRDMGTCLKFAGGTDTVLLASSNIVSGQTNFTIAAWIKRSGSAGANGSAFYCERATSGNDIVKLETKQLLKSLRLTYRDDAGTLNQIDGVANISDGKWHHVAVTKNGTAILFYVDGVVDGAGGTLTATNNFTNSNQRARIGSDQQDALGVYIGFLDDLKLYSRALSSTEINNLAHNVEPSTTGLVGWYKLDEGSGTEAIDSSGTRSNGTITTATYSTDVALKPRTAV